MRPVIALLSLALVIPSIAQAQQCRTVQGRVIYQQPAAAVQVVEQVIVTQALVTPVLVAQPVVIDPRINFVYGGGSLYPPQQSVICPQPSPSSSIKPKAEPVPCPQVNEDAIVEKLLQRLNQPSKPTPPPVPGISKVAFPTMTQTRTYADVLAANCMECHSASKAKGNFVMFDADGRLISSLDYDAVWSAIDKGRMPPASRPRIFPADLQVLKRDFGLEKIAQR